MSNYWHQRRAFKNLYVEDHLKFYWLHKDNNIDIISPVLNVCLVYLGSNYPSIRASCGGKLTLLSNIDNYGSWFLIITKLPLCNSCSAHCNSARKERIPTLKMMNCFCFLAHKWKLNLQKVANQSEDGIVIQTFEYLSSKTYWTCV